MSDHAPKDSRALRNLGIAIAAAGLLVLHRGKTLPRWLCTGCWAFYGEPGKVRYGYCATCFDAWLAESRLNVARDQQARKRRRVEQFIEMGELPR